MLCSLRSPVLAAAQSRSAGLSGLCPLAETMATAHRDHFGLLAAAQQWEVAVAAGSAGDCATLELAADLAHSLLEEEEKRSCFQVVGC